MRIGRLIIKKSVKFTFKAFKIKEPKFHLAWVLTLGWLNFVWLGFSTSDKPRNWPCPCGSGKKFKKCCQPYAYAMMAGLFKSKHPVRKRKKKHQTQMHQVRKRPKRILTGRKTLDVS